MLISRAAALLVCSLGLLAISGCLGDAVDQDDHDSDSERYEEEFKFCDGGRERLDVESGRAVYRLVGCPRDILNISSPAQRLVSIPLNSTGLAFVFAVSMVEPLIEAEIQIRNGTIVLISDTLQFVGGLLVGREATSDPDLNQARRTTVLIFGGCNATHLDVSWGSNAPLREAGLHVFSYGAGDIEDILPDQAPLCNDYWDP